MTISKILLVKFYWSFLFGYIAMITNRFLTKCSAFLLIASIFTFCATLIGPYSPTSYKYATSLKAETLTLMKKATEPYVSRKQDIEKVTLNLNKAYEYVKGVPANSISEKQWSILIDPKGDLIGKFFKRWKEKKRLSKVYIQEFSSLVARAFDSIICLEANKKETTECIKITAP